LWDFADMPWPVRLTEHVHRVRSLAFAPDGRSLATGSGDGTLVIWDLGKGKALHQFKNAHADEVTAIAFSPDGKYLVSADREGAVCFWDPQRDKERKKLHLRTPRPLCLTFAPDGHTLFVGGADQVLRWFKVGAEEIVPQGEFTSTTGWVKVA